MTYLAQKALDNLELLLFGIGQFEIVSIDKRRHEQKELHHGDIASNALMTTQVSIR